MFFLGELADESVAVSICNDLSKNGIAAEQVRSKEQNLTIIFIKNESDLLKAQDIFRVKTGGARTFEAPQEWSKIKSLKSGYLTKPVIVLCILIFLTQNYGGLAVYDLLKFSLDSNLSQIKAFELWRIFTPCLIHFGFMHIFFNLMWWKDLSKIIEFRFGALFLFIFCLVTGSLSNYSQFLVGGENFGGLSGIVFSLFGLNWMLSRFEKNYNYSLPKSDTVMMIGWFIFCLTGLLKFGVANMAHAMGLSLGMLTGLFVSFKTSTRKLEIMGFALLALVFIFLGKF